MLGYGDANTMTLDSTRRAFINWVRQVTNYSQDKVIWADQNMPRPIKSYIKV